MTMTTTTARLLRSGLRAAAPLRRRPPPPPSSSASPVGASGGGCGPRPSPTSFVLPLPDARHGASRARGARRPSSSSSSSSSPAPRPAPSLPDDGAPPSPSPPPPPPPPSEPPRPSGAASDDDDDDAERIRPSYDAPYVRSGPPPNPDLCPLSVDEIEALVAERDEKRAAKDWAGADALVTTLNDGGVRVEDGARVWHVDPSRCEWDRWGRRLDAGDDAEGEAAATAEGGKGREGDADRSREEDGRVRARAPPSRRAAADGAAEGREGDVERESRPVREERGYVRVGGPPSLETAPGDEEVNDLLSERVRLRRARDFRGADRLRDELIARGVQVNDDLRQWWHVVPRTDEARRAAKTVGHDYVRTGRPVNPSLCSLSEDEVHALLKERRRHRNKRDFDAADEVLKALNRCGVEVDDEAKRWRADGKSFASGGDEGLKSMKECRTMEEAADAIYERLKSVELRDLAAFWSAVPDWLGIKSAGFRSKNPQAARRFGAILAKTLEELNSFEGRHLAATALGLAKASRNAGRGADDPEEGSARNIARDTLVGPGGRNRRTIFRHVARTSQRAIDDLDPRCLANLANAFALAGHVPSLPDGTDLLDAIADRSAPALESFRPRGLSDLLGAHAALGRRNPALFEEAATVVLHLGSFHVRDAVRVLRSYATLGETGYPELFEDVGDYVVALSDAGEPVDVRDCADAVWSMAKAGIEHGDLFDAMAHRIAAAEDLDDVPERSLSDLVWAYATAERSDRRLFAKVADRVVAPSSSTAKEEAKRAPHAEGGRFDPRSLVDFLGAYAATATARRGQRKDRRVFATLAPRARGMLGDFAARDLADVAWAYAAADVAAPALFDSEFVRACREKEGEFSLEDLRRLHRWQSWQEVSGASTILPPVLREACRDAFAEADAGAPFAPREDVAS